MKIVLTGSLGHISLPLTQQLVAQGHTVTVVSSQPGRQEAIVALGAQAAIGSVTDVAFLTQTFAGADAVYGMIPPNYGAANQLDYYAEVGEAYTEAIRQSGVGRVVDLSSYGAHLPSGTGFIVGSYRVEQRLNTLTNVSITHIRPGYFYYNLFSFLPMIKAAGFIGTNYGGTDRLVLVSPLDIADAVAEELMAETSGTRIRYVVSDDRSCEEVAAVLGKAIGQPDLHWQILPNEQVQHQLETNGMPAPSAAMMVELGTAIHSGALREAYDRQPTALGKVKLEAFAHEFAGVFQRS